MSIGAKFYQYLHGDKDTFLLAALLTGVSLPVIEQRPFAGEGDLIQRDLDGDPFLQHRTSSKWKLYGPNQPVDRAGTHRPLRRGADDTATALDGRDLPCPRTFGAGAGAGIRVDWTETISL